MKLFLVILSLLSTAAFADDPKCAAFMPCGDYEGTGYWYNIDGVAKSAKYQEKILITAVDDKTVNIKVYIYSGTLGTPWTDSNINFDDKGQLNLVDSAGMSHGAGYCADNVCTISFRPVPVTEKGKTFINSFVNILRFENGHLKRYNMVADSSVDKELMFQRSDLVKK